MLFKRSYRTAFFFLKMGSLMTSSSSAGPIQISKFPEPCIYVIFNYQSFNDSLTNDIVSFEQLGPYLGLYCLLTESLDERNLLVNSEAQELFVRLMKSFN